MVAVMSVMIAVMGFMIAVMSFMVAVMSLMIAVMTEGRVTREPLQIVRGVLEWKSSRRRKGSNRETWLLPKARLRWTPAPSMVGLLFLIR